MVFSILFLRTISCTYYWCCLWRFLTLTCGSVGGKEERWISRKWGRSDSWWVPGKKALETCILVQIGFNVYAPWYTCTHYLISYGHMELLCNESEWQATHIMWWCEGRAIRPGTMSADKGAGGRQHPGLWCQIRGSPVSWDSVMGLPSVSESQVCSNSCRRCWHFSHSLPFSDTIWTETGPSLVCLHETEASSRGGICVMRPHIRICGKEILHHVNSHTWSINLPRRGRGPGRCLDCAQAQISGHFILKLSL